ncbi:MAG TPA: hypothetical protein VNH11_33025 [Pirellulales bacterium]|nr:hypothetical protein [Pirellulales bacterium]
MATDRLSRRILRRSLLTSLTVHVIALVVLTVLMHSVLFGPGQTLLLAVGTAEPFPEPEILVTTEWVMPPDASDILALESAPFAESDHAIEAVAPEVCWLDAPHRSDNPPSTPQSSTEGASFFGTAALGDQFVYVVDISPSMNIGWGRGPGQISRLIRALAELRASIERLSPGQSFYVVLFNGETRRMFDDESVLPRALPATPENKRRLNAWLASVRTGESTDPRRALQLALKMRPSALFLLSDGRFDQQATSVFELIDRQKGARTPIHTIAYEDARSCRDLEQIARLTGGEYRFVPPPAHQIGQLPAPEQRTH